MERMRQRLRSWKEIFWRKAAALIAGVWFLIGAWDLVKSEFLPETYQNITVIKMTPHMQWRTWVIVALAILTVELLEGAHSAMQKRNVLIDQQRPTEPPPNLQINWGGLIMGPIFLGDDGVWSSYVAPSSSDAARYKYIGIRIRVSNPHVRARKVGPATGVSGLVEFTYDTGAAGMERLSCRMGARTIFKNHYRCGPR